MAEKLVATDELYLQNKATIEKACIRAWRKNPLVSLDDYRSYADEVFMDAVNSYNPAAGAKFNSWLTTQLLRLKPYANRGGAMTTDSRGTAESLVMSLDMVCSVEGKPCTLLDKKQPTNDTYSAEIGVPTWATSWEQRMEELKPYMGSLSDDARVLVDDILDGNASKRDENGVPQLEHGRRLYTKLTPRQLYVRLYRKRGWAFERVRDARIEIENMLRKWAPCKLPPPGEMVQVQDELF